jgi:hypothetical protein
MMLAAPPTWKIIDGAFFSNEQLTQNIARPFVFIGAAILLGLVAMEWLIRSMIVWRRREAADGTG